MFVTFWTSGPRSGPQKSYFCNMSGHICFICFAYYFHIIVYAWAGAPVHSAIFESISIHDLMLSSIILLSFEGVCETHVILTPGAVEVGVLTALHATTSGGPAGPAGSAGEFIKARCYRVLRYLRALTPPKRHSIVSMVQDHSMGPQRAPKGSQRDPKARPGSNTNSSMTNNLLIIKLQRIKSIIKTTGKRGFLNKHEFDW